MNASTALLAGLVFGAGLLLSGMADPGKIAGETLGRFLDPMSLALVGGSQVGETIRRLTEGPRFADLGAIERRMAKVLELWLQVQQAARSYEAVVANAWAEANQRFTAELTLTNRSLLGFRMLLGREALRRRFAVDPGGSYRCGRHPGRVNAP